MYENAIKMNPNKADAYFQKGKKFVFIFQELHLTL